MNKKNSASEILRRRFGNDPEYQQMLAEERLIAQASQAIYDARTAAGLTQEELAERIGTSQPAIARLESGDYDKHSVATLQKIADSLGARLSIRILPASEEEPKPMLSENAVRAVVREEMQAMIPALCEEMRRVAAATVVKTLAER